MTAPWTRWVVVAVLAVLWGCAVIQPPQVSRQHDVQFVVPSFYRELVGAGGVAVLPFIGGVGPEGIRNDAAFELAQAYRRAFPRSTVITREDLLRNLRPQGLDQTLVQLITKYENSQKLDPSLMLRLGQSVSVRYLAYGRLVRFSEKDDAGQRQKEVVVYSELWDLPCKTVVWSGTGSERVQESLQQAGTPMGDLFVGALSEAVAAVGPATGKKVEQVAVAC
jgi:hypothetical protein